MKLAMTEIYEVATFYHHLDVIKDGEKAPPPITVRVCDSIACDIAGSRELLNTLTARLGPDVRVLRAPCVGRCDTAPVAVVGQNPVPHATTAKVTTLAAAKAVNAAGDGVHPSRYHQPSPWITPRIPHKRWVCTGGCVGLTAAVLSAMGRRSDAQSRRGLSCRSPWGGGR
jgi:hypothetical protein